MYLSKIKLDFSQEHVKKCLRNCQLMHTTIMHLFGCSRKDAGVLYRIDWQGRCLYIMSRHMPDNRVLFPGFTFLNMSNIDHFVQLFAEGVIFNFDVLVSPCKQVRLEGCKTSKKRFIIRSKDRMQWFYSRSERFGFEIIQCDEQLKTVFYGKHDADSGTFYYPSVRFFGVLRIVDVDLFKKAFCFGIGPGKSYGLGMFLLKKPF